MGATSAPPIPPAACAPSCQRRAALALGTRVAALITLAVLSGCGSVIARQELPDAVPRAEIAQRVDLVGRNGPLGLAASQRTLQQVRGEGGADLVDHHLAQLAAQDDVALYRGNAARLLVDGPQTFKAMKSAIEGARQRVLMESYIFEDQGVAAEFGALLQRKAAEGVRVALVVDSVGSIGSDPAFFEALAAGGVAVCAFNPINPLQRLGQWGLSHRTHRKLLVVDNEVAFTGGINISRVYASGSFLGGRPRALAKPLEDGWRDTQIELRGPVVPALARTFIATWADQSCGDAPAGPEPQAAGVPASALVEANRPDAAGNRLVKVITSDPRDPQNRIYTTLLASIEASQRSVHLTMAYFAPGEEMVAALCDAARRGVDVSLVLPGYSDFSLLLHAGRSYYTQLLGAGVRIHEYRHATMHAKTMVVDGVFSTVGSSNMDWRSFVANNEINVVVIGRDFGRELEALFQRDVAASQPVLLEAWAQRPWGQRLLERFGRSVERLL